MLIDSQSETFKIYAVNINKAGVIGTSAPSWLTSVVRRDIAPVGDSRAHLIQSPVGAQRQQIIVLSLQDLTCLRGEGGKKKKKKNVKMKHNTTHSALHRAIFSRAGNRGSWRVTLFALHIHFTWLWMRQSSGNSQGSVPEWQLADLRVLI